jgi:4-aminobutyrate aminotransferase-like enzyme/Ser/Thr protein kinase RdoA (MazF antagonist)
VTTGTEFSDAVRLPAPRVDEAWARRVVQESFGIDATAHRLGSNQDANFLMRTPAGQPVAVLKVSNPAFGAEEVSVQDDAADRVAAACPELRVAQVLRADDGVAMRTTVATPDGPAVARLIRFIDGGTLFDKGYLDQRSVTRLGEVAAEIDLALAGITGGDGLDRVLQWDLQHADRTVATLGSSLPAARRAEIEGAAARAWDLLAPLVDELPVQVVHLDLTDDNSVLRADGLVDGVIDFSDLTRTWTVSELAITISSVLHHPGAEPASVLPAVRAYHARRPLSEAEVDAIWPLVVLRAAVLVVSGCHQVALDGDNDYAETRLVKEWRIADQALSVPPEVMTALIRHDLGLGASGAETAAAVPDGVLLAVPDALVLDLSPQSPLLDDGAWEDADVVETLAGDTLAAGHRAVVTRFGEARLAGSRALVQAAPPSVATGVDLWTAGSEELTAPWPCEVSSDDSGLVLHADDVELVVHGVQALATGAVAAGAVVATTVPRGRTRITAGRGMADVPEGVAAHYAPGWLATLVDPAPVLGLPATGPDGTAGAGESVLEQRGRALAEVQEHYYREPPRIERGWRHFLVTEEGRPLLDMVNNVAVVGHSHPRLARTAERQLRLLNTNSRFNYEAIAAFGARLADLAPDPLDTVFLVNSGSEAADLAIRLALVATGRSDMVAMSEAYHGWTYASDAVSTSVADNPNALQTRPDWVHTVPAPNTYRGRHRGADGGSYGPEAAAIIDELATSGRPPAGFIGESFYGNAGGMPLPDGYLAAVWSAVRRHGGLAIADEVQVGYGRLGHWFWGFEQQGVVPDIIAVAKAVGNGVPVGAVITSRAVADQYRNAGYFFSSTGGSPLSSRIGLCVLDILRDEDLQGNARDVGGHLKSRLEELGQRHELIGAVHGNGLYLGVELVRDRTTLEPAPEETGAICDRMLDLGVVIQPTSDRMNVLKVKPPLCLDRSAADFFVDTLDRVLSEGW